MVAFRRSSPFTHRHFTHLPRLVASSSSSPSGPSRGSSSTDAPSSSSPDSELSKERNSTYPVYLVIVFLIVLFVFSICDALYRANLFIAKRRKHGLAKEAQTPGASGTAYDQPYYGQGAPVSYPSDHPESENRPLFERYFLAVVSALRVLSFRKTSVALFKVLVGGLYFFICLFFFVANSELYIP